MKLEKVTVNFGKTVNLGNYESFRYDVEFSAKLSENDNPETATEILRQLAKLQVEKAIRYQLRGEPKTSDREDIY